MGACAKNITFLLMFLQTKILSGKIINQGIPLLKV